MTSLVSAWGGWKCKLPTQPSLAWVVGPQFSSVLFTGVELLLSKCFCLFYVASLEVPWLVLLLALEKNGCLLAFLGSWFFQVQVWGVWGRTKLHPSIYHPFALRPSHLPSVQLSESLNVYFMYNIQDSSYCFSIKIVLLYFHKNLIHIFYANVNWKISLNIDSQGSVSKDDCWPVSEWQALPRSVGWGSPWTAMQEGSQNMPSVLRFRDPMEVLVLLRINAVSSWESMMRAGRSPHSHRLFSGRF